MSRAWLLLLALPLLGAGCSDKSFALVSVLSTSGQFNDVAQLTVEVQSGASFDTLSYPSARTERLFPFDQTTPLTFSIGYKGSSHKGPLFVAVTALNKDGAPLGYGETTQAMADDDVTKITVAITRDRRRPERADGGVPDGGPPAEAGTACDPVTPTTCNGGTCYLSCPANQPTVGMCTMAGAKKPGELCEQNEDCVPGTQCFAFSCGTSAAVKTCLRFCKNDAVCGTGTCSTPLPCMGKMTDFKACSQACNPVGDAQQGCAAGLHCFVFAGELPDCDCAGTLHVKEPGTACTTSEECKPGHLCVSMTGAKVCRPICRLDMPSTCTVGTCTKLVDPDYQTFGACVP
jgi:hypothetical protein